MSYSPPFNDITLQVNRSPLEGAVSRLSNRLVVNQELSDTLIGATAGATASVTRPRVQHSQSELGGVRVVETNSRINRVSTSADRVLLRAINLKSSRIATPADGAGDFPA